MNKGYNIRKVYFVHLQESVHKFLNLTINLSKRITISKKFRNLRVYVYRLNI